MTSLKRIAAPAALMLALACGTPEASAWDIKDVLGGGGDVTETVGNLIEGVFTKSDLTVGDLCGQWITDGSAVSFKSDNFLKKAGGVAAAAALETKINPYFEQLGLNNALMTVQADGSFTLNAKRFTLGGVMGANGDGTFEFEFRAFGRISLGKMTAYVQKSGNHVDIMFDATKVKTLVSAIARYTGTTMAKTAATVLDSYDGLCVGFGMDRKSGSSSNQSGTRQGNKKDSGKQNQTPDSAGGLEEAAGTLLNILKGAGSGK